MRVTLLAYLGRARIHLQVDIGFGNTITPSPRAQDFPTLLPLPAPRLRTYPIETVVAEKFEAMVRFGRSTSRMKDLRDLTTFARRCEFDGEVLGRAVLATFSRRETNLEDLDDVLDPEFFEDAELVQRRNTYCRTSDLGDAACRRRDRSRLAAPLDQWHRSSTPPEPLLEPPTPNHEIQLTRSILARVYLSSMPNPHSTPKPALNVCWQRCSITNV